MKQRQTIIELAVMVIAVLAITSCRPDPALSATTINEKPKEPTRLEQLVIQHQKMMQKRADVLKAVAELEKQIIKIEGQIEEAKWTEINAKK
jgi:hypothetical protein